MTKPKTITEQAAELGRNSLDAFTKKTGETPTAENIGEWSESAWQIHWKELKDAGATEADFVACSEAWSRAFWQRDKRSQEGSRD